MCLSDLPPPDGGRVYKVQGKSTRLQTVCYFFLTLFWLKFDKIPTKCKPRLTNMRSAKCFFLRVYAALRGGMPLPPKNRFVIYVDCSKAGKRGAVMRFVVGSATMNLFLFLRLGYSL